MARAKKTNTKKVIKTPKRPTEKSSGKRPVLAVLIATLGLFFFTSLISHIISPFTGGFGVITSFISRIFFNVFGISSFLFVFIALFFTRHYLQILSMKEAILKSIYVTLLIVILGSLIGLFSDKNDSLMVGYIGFNLSSISRDLFTLPGSIIIILGLGLSLIIAITDIEPLVFWKNMKIFKKDEDNSVLIESQIEPEKKEEKKPENDFKNLYVSEIEEEKKQSASDKKDIPEIKIESSQGYKSTEPESEIEPDLNTESYFHFPSDEEIAPSGQTDINTNPIKEAFEKAKREKYSLSDRPIEISEDDITIIGWDEPDNLTQKGPNEENMSLPKPPRKKQSIANKYTFPSLSLLKEQSPIKLRPSEDELSEIAQAIKDKLADFAISCEITEIKPGPVVTRFVVKLAAGVKVSRILSLQDDLALAMRVQSLRILAPIPGQPAVGIEIPNPKPDIISIKNVLEDPSYLENQDGLTLALGRTCSDKPFFVELQNMPHLLIAGATGTGKSVCINSLITSLVYKFSPEKLRLIMIDPKVLELSMYNGIPHLLWQVITQPREAVKILQWAVDEMERRYLLLSKLKVRSIIGFNEKLQKLISENDEMKDINEEELKPIPYIIIIIDEYADLKMTTGKEVEIPITRLAQKARAVGIHIILATQRPEVKIIGGLIKSNFPSRISFQVPSKYDSRTILDRIGAEKLLGRGDMFFLPAGRKDPYRIHGAFITDEEAEKVAEFLKTQNSDAFWKIDASELEKAKGTDAFLTKTDDDESYGDNLFFQAGELVLRHDQASASFLQRRMQIGYPRAAKLIDLLEEKGVIGPASGSKKRDCLIGIDEFIERFKK
ncbi:MAG: DNA translocase FtsK 4TM domain-containing protein [Candidatus Coatesbacteria bacterium]|nr:DNA translocase FtsK 4TM domain-containing protein [Candidatus Coatesbacteria bacterium]